MDRAKLEAMLAQQEKEAAALMKELKMDGMDDDDDDDMRALNRDLAKQQKLAHGNDDEEMDDDDLLAELGEMHDDDDEDPAVKEQELKGLVDKFKKLAMQEKKANNIEQAKNNLRQAKSYEEELKLLYKMYPKLNQVQQQQPKQAQPQQQQHQAAPTKQIAPQAAPKQGSEKQNAPVQHASNEDAIEMEEQFHDPDPMCSMSVLENEMELMQAMIAKSKGSEKEFFSSKLSSLQFAQEMIESNIGIGVMTPVKYLSNIKGYLASQEQLLAQSSKSLDSKSQHLQRIKKRIELIEQEIKDSEEAEEEEQKENQVMHDQEETKKHKPQQQQNQGHPQQQQQQVHREQQQPPQQFNEAQYLKRTSIIEDSIDWTKVDKKTYDTLNERIVDYRQATQYAMTKLGDRKKAMEFLATAEQFANLKHTVVSGKKIDLLKIAPPVTPSVVLGFDEATRMEKFNIIIEEVNKQFEEHKERAHKLVAGSKEVKKKQDQDSLKKLAQEEIAKAQALKQQMTQLNQMKANPWQAPPITHHETVFTKIEKTNPDIKQQRLKLTYSPSEAMKKSGCCQVKYQIDLNEATRLKGYFDVDKQLTTEIIVENQSLWKLIDKKDFVLTLKKRKFLWSKEKVDTKKFRLSELASKCDLEKDVKLGGFDINFTFQVNTPIKEKEMQQIPMQKLIVDQFPEPYKGGSGQSSQPVQQQQQQAKPMAQQQQQQQVKQQQVRNQQSIKKVPSQQQAKTQPTGPLPEGITIEDVQDPDNMKNMTCVSYIEKKIADIQGFMNKCIEDGVRAPADVKTKFFELSKQKAIISNQANSGKLTPEMYNQYLTLQMGKDMALFKYFMDNNQPQKAQIVKERIGIIKQEMSES